VLFKRIFLKLGLKDNKLTLPESSINSWILAKPMALRKIKPAMLD
jgi:hypothetical protein